MPIPGKLVIISGPSGAGKSTVVSRLITESSLPLLLSVSATTRPPRTGEENGKNYWFLSDDEFEQKRRRGEFLECKEVFGRGFWYGTLKETVKAGLESGKWVILEIDVQGALTVQQQFPSAITIFVHPGSMEELERRLRARKTDPEEAIRRRLDVAFDEMSLRHNYTHEVINDSIDTTVERIDSLLQQYQGEETPCSKS
ncbi:guanylate kinase [Pirellulaceae bacterium SH449]